jgi:tetrapyrrole methylase family protein/MazG family protein
MRAEKVQKRASRAGFDWKDARGTIRKLDEEIREFKKAVTRKKKRNLEEELGDILFSLVNVSRFYKTRPEEALGKTVSKFMKRFAYMEKKAGEMGLLLQEMTLPQMDELWEEAKKQRKRR